MSIRTLVATLLCLLPVQGLGDPLRLSHAVAAPLEGEYIGRAMAADPDQILFTARVQRQDSAGMTTGVFTAATNADQRAQWVRAGTLSWHNHGLHKITFDAGRALLCGGRFTHRDTPLFSQLIDPATGAERTRFENPVSDEKQRVRFGRNCALHGNEAFITVT